MTDVSNKTADEQLAALKDSPNYLKMIELFEEDLELVRQLQQPETDTALLMQSIGWTVDCALEVYGIVDPILTGQMIYTLLMDEEVTYHTFSEYMHTVEQEVVQQLIQTILKIAISKLPV